MAEPQYQSSATNTANATTVSPTYMGSISAGDLLIYCWTMNNVATTLSSEPGSLNQIGSELTNGNRKMRLYWKIATGSESGSITWTLGSSARQCAAILRYTGAHGSSPLDTSGSSTGNSTTITAPSINTAENEEVVLRFASTSTAADLTNPATSRVSINQGGQLFLGISDQAAAVAGATGTSDFTSTGTAQYITASVAFKKTASGIVVPVGVRLLLGVGR